MRTLFSNPHRSARREDTENFYWISFSDVMAGLLAIFILALIAIMVQMVLQKNRLEQEKSEIEQEKLAISQKVATIEKNLEKIQKISEFRKKLLEEIQRELDAKGIRVEIDEESLRIPEKDIYFRKREWQIPEKVKDNLGAVGKVVLSVLQKRNATQWIETIFIEGHTDARPYFEKRGNWGLSADRAIAVWRFWEEQVSELMSLKNNKLFSVSGYGATRLVEPHAKSEEDHQKNRRIDLRFLMIEPDAIKLQKLKEALAKLSNPN